ncbi:uncharacterized protein LOC135225268 [Macrobrachium nipponense]|uniref:uncharacterized protein LOC135225268 n=1 Tax=Macrobrachium nipponense TaxID=159736 RepID=UPI0030C835CA
MLTPEVVEVPVGTVTARDDVKPEVVEKRLIVNNQVVEVPVGILLQKEIDVTPEVVEVPVGTVTEEIDVTPEVVEVPVRTVTEEIDVTSEVVEVPIGTVTEEIDVTAEVAEVAIGTVIEEIDITPGAADIPVGSITEEFYSTPLADELPVGTVTEEVDSTSEVVEVPDGTVTEEIDITQVAVELPVATATEEIDLAAEVEVPVGIVIEETGLTPEVVEISVGTVTEEIDITPEVVEVPVRTVTDEIDMKPGVVEVPIGIVTDETDITAEVEVPISGTVTEEVNVISEVELSVGTIPEDTYVSSISEAFETSPGNIGEEVEIKLGKVLEDNEMSSGVISEEIVSEPSLELYFASGSEITVDDVFEEIEIIPKLVLEDDKLVPVAFIEQIDSKPEKLLEVVEIVAGTVVEEITAKTELNLEDAENALAEALGAGITIVDAIFGEDEVTDKVMEISQETLLKDVEILPPTVESLEVTETDVEGVGTVPSAVEETTVMYSDDLEESEIGQRFLEEDTPLVGIDEKIKTRTEVLVEGFTVELETFMEEIMLIPDAAVAGKEISLEKGAEGIDVGEGAFIEDLEIIVPVDEEIYLTQGDISGSTDVITEPEVKAELIEDSSLETTIVSEVVEKRLPEPLEVEKKDFEAMETSIMAENITQIIFEEPLHAIDVEEVEIDFEKVGQEHESHKELAVTSSFLTEQSADPLEERAVDELTESGLPSEEIAIKLVSEMDAVIQIDDDGMMTKRTEENVPKVEEPQVGLSGPMSEIVLDGVDDEAHKIIIKTESIPLREAESKSQSVEAPDSLEVTEAGDLNMAGQPSIQDGYKEASVKLEIVSDDKSISKAEESESIVTSSESSDGNDVAIEEKIFASLVEVMEMAMVVAVSVKDAGLEIVAFLEEEALDRELGGEGAVMDGSESSEGESADMSLSEGLLKTSHNLWLALTGAVQLPEGLAFGFEAEIAEPQVSNGMLVFLLIVSGTVVTIYFVHLVMMAWHTLLCKISREGPLLEALNRIDHENRVKADENESLHAELTKARAELESVASRVTTSSGDVNEISSQLEMVKNEYANEKIQLEERIVQLEHELEEATTNGLEMHKMLSEMLAAQKEASAFQASIDHLQSMLDGQREKVETLTSDLALKNRLNEELHSELSSSMERANKLDYMVEQLTHSLEELTGVKGEAIRKLQEEAALVEELKQANTSLTQQTGEYDSKVTSLSSELTDLRETISQLRESVETKESELQVAKECLKQLRLTSSDDSAAPDEEKLSALFDVIRVKAELQKVNNDRLNLVEQLQDAEMAQKNLEEAMASIRTEVTELRTHHDVAIREKQEAMSKLEVLTKYFEEKEAQLTKELESQEGLRVNAEGSAAVVAKKIQNYELELASYKKHKKHSTFVDIKPKRQLYQLPPEVINLSDLSPTTANVPLSDEYKVEWVKARAEMKRRKSSASSTDKSDKASVSPTSNRNSAGSSYPSSESLACPSDSSTNLVDSPIRPCRRKDVKLSDDDDAKEHRLIRAHTVDVVPAAAAVSTEPVSISEMIEISPLRPSSLTVMTGSHPVSVVYSASRPSVFHRTVSPVGRSGSLNDDLPSTFSEIKKDIPVVTEERVMKRELSIPSLCLDDDVTESVKESPASDDFKSSVAAIRSFYEAKKGILLGKSKNEPGFRLRTQVETLRKELEEQEASYKSQITIHEQKAHENWLQARSAERKNEEQRQENSQLRGRLTMLQKEKEEVQQSQVNIIKPTPKRVDANGTMSSPRPMVDGVDGDHSGPPSLHRDLDSPP